MEGVVVVIAEPHDSRVLSAPLAASYAACETIARRAASSFYPMFRFLPAAQRRAMCAVYAFMRIADDIGDEPGIVDNKREQLQHWRESLGLALAGAADHAIHPALVDTVRRYNIPIKYLEAALDGVAMDLSPAHYATFGDLRNYCYHVASVVGLACIHIWGFAGERAEDYAVNAGIAFQLTNILRDLGEDAARGRVYLPSEDLNRFGYSAEQLRQAVCDDRFRELMRFQIARAREFYAAAWPLVPMLQPAGRTVFVAMAKTYRALLDVMERRDYDVFSSRIRVSRWRKLMVVLGALPARWGW
ncbi:MAG TPA: phytoene/squalene synthase family protein [Gemmataceae bacterium]|nr:phytoene/squalene synthase family protein [Gemmataceae bacterium]